MAPGWWILPGALIGAAILSALLWLALSPIARVIDYDPGGGINTYAAQIAMSEPAEIRGYCASACTMWLGNGCVHRDARLIFHGPQQVRPDRFDHWSAVMARHYPPALADWFMSVGRFGQYEMSGAGAIALGAQECGN